MAVPEDDQRVHQNLVRMMDRRLSNVQLQQHFYEEQRHRHRHNSNGSSGVSSPRRSIDRQEQRRSILQQPRSSLGAKSSNGGSLGGAYESRNGANNDRYAGYYLGYVGQAAHKRRRTTFWETLTGLVCSLGALASRAAKMAARRGDPL